MKTLKKCFVLLLTLVLALSLCVPALATQEGTLMDGSITINDAVPGETYKAYQILYLESYDTTAKAYAYKANTAWTAWLKANATAYLNINDQGYVTWVGDNTDARAQEFAKLAKSAGIAADDTKTAPAAAQGQTYSTVTFSGLKLGWYLVDTSLGTLCALDTTNPNATMQEKNELPTVTKQVQEDSTQLWGESNTAQIGETVNFKTVISAKKGAKSYVLHDTMSAGLTLDANSITVKKGETPLTVTTDYTVQTSSGNPADGCDFEITFTQTYLDSLTENTDITVTYSATLNKDAVIYDGTNTNKTWLTYGADGKTTEVETKTYTYSFDLVKTDSDKSCSPAQSSTFTMPPTEVIRLSL